MDAKMKYKIQAALGCVLAAKLAAGIVYFAWNTHPNTMTDLARKIDMSSLFVPDSAMAQQPESATASPAPGAINPEKAESTAETNYLTEEKAPRKKLKVPSAMLGPTPQMRELNTEMFESLQQKESELNKREDELKREEERLASIRDDMQKDMQKEMDSLKLLQAKIDEEMKMRPDIEAKDIKKLAKMYLAVPPANAATLFEKMDRRIAVRLLSEMKAKNAGKILAEMRPEIASSMSEQLVTRKKQQ